MLKLLSGKLIYMIVHFSAINQHKMYEFKWNTSLNVLSDLNTY